MNVLELLQKLENYGFTDKDGHPLEFCTEFVDLVEYVKAFSDVRAMTPGVEEYRRLGTVCANLLSRAGEKRVRDLELTIGLLNRASIYWEDLRVFTARAILGRNSAIDLNTELFKALKDCTAAGLNKMECNEDGIRCVVASNPAIANHLEACMIYLRSVVLEKKQREVSAQALEKLPKIFLPKRVT